MPRKPPPPGPADPHKPAEVKQGNQDFKKHVAAIHIENRLSLLERKLANVLLLHAYPDLPNRVSYRIRIGHLAAAVGFDSNDVACLKEALINLMGTVLTWNVLNDKGSEIAWRARPMLIEADIEQGWCTYAYHDDLRRQFYNPEIYARINLSIQQKFTSGFAFALYENCLRFLKTGSTGWLELRVVRKLLGVADNAYYDDFRRLNGKVLKPAICQVNETSDILLSCEQQTEKRRVVALRFLVRSNPQMTLFATPANALPALLPAAEQVRLSRRLQECGLRPREVSHFLEIHNAAYLDTNLDIVATLLAEGAIRTTLRATTLDALKHDYRPAQSLLEQQQAALGRGQRADSGRRQTAARLTDETALRAAFEKERLDQALAALSATARQALETAFAAFIAAEPAQTALRPLHRRAGLNNALVQGCFRQFVRERLLPAASEAEFLSYRAAQTPARPG